MPSRNQIYPSFQYCQDVTISKCYSVRQSVYFASDQTSIVEKDRRKALRIEGTKKNRNSKRRTRMLSKLMLIQIIVEH
jgi:negative regulator of replication initiation